MRVKLLTKSFKEKRQKKAEKEKDKFFQKAVDFEYLTIKLYKKAQKRLRRKSKNKEKVEILDHLINEDEKHLEVIKRETGKNPRVSIFRLLYHYFLSAFFGMTFSLRVLEIMEEKLHFGYLSYIDSNSPIIYLAKEEQNHKELLDKILEEYKLVYTSMVVLGLNDAIVEMSAAIAGYTFAIQSELTIYITSLITGISAALSMGASAFLSARQDKALSPIRAMFLTGIAYILTVIVLTIPYIPIIKIPTRLKWVRMLIMLSLAFLIVLVFNFYISVAKKQSLVKNFFTMAGIALVIALISFGIGLLVNKVVDNVKGVNYVRFRICY